MGRVTSMTSRGCYLILLMPGVPTSVPSSWSGSTHLRCSSAAVVRIVVRYFRSVKILCGWLTAILTIRVIRIAIGVGESTFPVGSDVSTSVQTRTRTLDPFLRFIACPQRFVLGGISTSISFLLRRRARTSTVRSHASTTIFYTVALRSCY